VRASRTSAERSAAPLESMAFAATRSLTLETAAALLGISGALSVQARAQSPGETLESRQSRSQSTAATLGQQSFPAGGALPRTARLHGSPRRRPLLLLVYATSYGQPGTQLRNGDRLVVGKGGYVEPAPRAVEAVRQVQLASCC
jgi:hypothetical protein